MNKEKEKKAIYTTYFSLLSSAILALVKWMAGIFGHSYALIADAIESTTDIFASLLVLLGLKYAQRPADENHPYGHGKVEPLVTFMVVGFLIVSATMIGIKSYENILTPHELPKPWTLIILAIIIGFKEYSFRKVMHTAKATNSTSLVADAWHHRSDMITSLAAFIGISIALFLGKGFEYIDDIAAMFAAVFILYNCYKIFRPALGEIMDENVYPELVQDIRNVALEVKGIKGTEKCYVRKVGNSFHVDLHAMVDGSLTVEEGHKIAHDLKDDLMSKLPQIANVLVHIEPK
ncbi:MAG TPA: cation diffusion facilitator family transporter [Edaphocola sp.]|nr:cation diffusion facilitator family transporter [Edaphocola sp.]